MRNGKQFTENATLGPILLEKEERKMTKVTLRLKAATKCEINVVSSGLLNASLRPSFKLQHLFSVTLCYCPLALHC